MIRTRNSIWLIWVNPLLHDNALNFDAFEIYYVFENIMENEAFAPWRKRSIFHNIFKVFKTVLKFFLNFFSILSKNRK